MKTISLVVSLLLGSGPLLAQRPAVVQTGNQTVSTVQYATAVLPSRPSVGDMLFAIIGYNTYGDRFYSPPDSSWSCTSSQGPATKFQTCTHVVVAGDGTSYTFNSGTSDGPGGGGLLLAEMSGTVGYQVAYLATRTAQTTLAMPPVTPTVLGTLPFVAIVGANSPSTPAGYTAYSIGYLANSLTTDTTPVSPTITVANNYSNSAEMTLLFTPGAFAQSTTYSPAPGTFAGSQTVTLATATAGGVIHYTMDGSVASCASPVYSAPLAAAKATSISSIVCANGYANSAVTAANYVIGAGTLSGVSLGPNASLNTYVPWSGDLWHQDISAVPVDPNSATIMAKMTAVATNIRHDWASTNNQVDGIPYVVVDSTLTPLKTWATSQDPNYVKQSDLAPAPIPAGIPIEQNPGQCYTTGGDHHAIVFDRAPPGRLYEWWHFQDCPSSTPEYSANNGAIFDLSLPSSAQRPFSYTSADAAALSIFEGLVRYDEILAGQILHAIRFTYKFADCLYSNGSPYSFFQLPSTSGTSACTTGNSRGANNIVNYGMKLRLKSSFDISSYSPTNQIILTALKRYGLMFADLSNNNTLDFQGAPDPRWNDADLATLDSIALSNFEVSQKGTVYDGANNYPRDPNSADLNGSPVAIVGTPAPAIGSFTASSPVVVLGSCVTLSATATNANLLFVDLAGVMANGSVKECPTALGPKTYTLTASGLSLTHDDGTGDGYRPHASTSVLVVPGGIFNYFSFPSTKH